MILFIERWTCCLGVAIVESESGNEGITMELEMQWDGNPNIVLDIRTRVGVGLPVQVISALLLYALCGKKFERYILLWILFKHLREIFK